MDDDYLDLGEELVRTAHRSFSPKNSNKKEIVTYKK